METAKKSFVLFYDSMKVLEELDDDQCWKLLRRMVSYHNWDEYHCSDKLVNIAFISFVNQFDRDMEKYASVCERNRGNIKKRYSTKSTTGSSGLPKSTKSTYKDTDKDTDSDKDTTNKKNTFFEEFLKSIESDKLKLSLREWWDYKKGKYTELWWKKTISIAMKYDATSVCNRIDEAISSGWAWMNLNTMKDAEAKTERPTRRIDPDFPLRNTAMMYHQSDQYYKDWEEQNNNTIS